MNEEAFKVGAKIITKVLLEVLEMIGACNLNMEEVEES